MGTVKSLLALVLCSAATLTAKGDTLLFTATVTSQGSQQPVPQGTTYTGYAHFEGTIDAFLQTTPPPIDKFFFSYPTSPTDLSDFWLATIQHLHDGDTSYYVLLDYLDPSRSAASFSLGGPVFQILNPYNISPNEYSATVLASGTVTYTYETDPVGPPPVSAVPEPSTLCLVGSGIVGAFGVARRRFPRA